jgi:phage tail-like protein
MLGGGDMLKILYEKRLPALYRVADEPKLYLKRYLSALCEGGFDALLSDINGMRDMMNPQKTPDAFLPAFLRSVGLPYYEDIPLPYLRKLLAQFGGLYARRGTYGGLRYLVRVLTGMECSIEYARGYAGPPGQEAYGRWVSVDMAAATPEETINLPIHRKVVERYIKDFFPYYIGIGITATVVTQMIMPDDIVVASAVAMEASYNLRGL